MTTSFYDGQEYFAEAFSHGIQKNTKAWKILIYWLPETHQLFEEMKSEMERHP